MSLGFGIISFLLETRFLMTFNTSEVWIKNGREKAFKFLILQFPFILINIITNWKECSAIIKHAVMFDRMGWGVDKLYPHFVVDNPGGSTPLMI